MGDYIYVIVAESLDPSMWLEIAFFSREAAEKWLGNHPSNETVSYSIEEVICVDS